MSIFSPFLSLSSPYLSHCLSTLVCIVRRYPRVPYPRQDLEKLFALSFEQTNEMFIEEERKALEKAKSRILRRLAFSTTNEEMQSFMRKRFDLHWRRASKRMSKLRTVSNLVSTNSIFHKE